MKNKAIQKGVMGGVAGLAILVAMNPQNIFANTTGATEQAEIAINELNFPDAGFRQYILDEIDVDKNQSLSETERSKTELHVYQEDMWINDLTGLEHFEDLEKLHIHYYGGTELDLSEFTGLTTFSLAIAPELATLELSGLDYDEITLMYCLKLSDLQLEAPNLGELLIMECNELKHLDLSGCGDGFVLSVMSEMYSLDLSHNKGVIPSTIRAEHTVEQPDTTINLKEVDPYLDVTKVRNLKNATLDENGNLTVHTDAVEGAGYLYDCGNGIFLEVAFYTEGLACVDGVWAYYSKGNVDWLDLIAENEYGAWLVLGGYVDFSYNGYYTYEDEVYYITNGHVDTTVTGVGLYNGDWVYLKEGKLDKAYTGLASNWYGWWYIKDGYVDFSYTGLSENEYGNWYVKGGAVQFGTTGFIEISGGIYYITNGYIDTTVTGVGFYNGDWWYVNQGIVDTTFDGIASNWYGTWYIQDGKVDFSFTGTVEFEGIEYQVEAGKVVK